MVQAVARADQMVKEVGGIQALAHQVDPGKVRAEGKAGEVNANDDTMFPKPGIWGGIMSTGKFETDLSLCCSAPVRIKMYPDFLGGTTRRYVCTACNQPCDILVNGSITERAREATEEYLRKQKK